MTLTIQNQLNIANIKFKIQISKMGFCLNKHNDNLKQKAILDIYFDMLVFILQIQSLLRRIMLTLLITAVSLSAYSQNIPIVKYQMAFGGSMNDGLRQLIPLEDGSLVFAGFSYSSDGDLTDNNGGADFWVVKTNSDFEIIWQSNFGGTGNDTAKSIARAPDGGFLLAGVTYSNDIDVSSNHGGADFWLVKINQFGLIEWEQTYGGTGDDIANSIVATADSGFIIAGRTNSTNGDVSQSFGANDMWVVKIDSIGNIEWESSFGGSGNDAANSIIQSFSGDYVVTGYNNSNAVACGGAMSIIKIDQDGELIWENCYGSNWGYSSHYANAIKETTDSGYITNGFKPQFGPGNRTGMYIVKTTINGQQEWVNTYTTSASYPDGKDISITMDGGYVAAGTADDPIGFSYNNFHAYKMNSAGSTEWIAQVRANNTDHAFSINQLPNGNYLIAGASNSTWWTYAGFMESQPILQNGGYDAWIVELCTPDELDIIISHPAYCTHTTLNATEGFEQYLWSTGETGNSITINSGGSYSVTATNLEGCPSRKSINVPAPLPPGSSGDTVFIEIQNQDYCISTTLTATGGFESYLWNTGSTEQSIEIIEGGSYTVTAINEVGCASNAFIEAPAPLPVGSAGYVSITPSDTLYCTSIRLTATTGFATYLWNTGETTESIIATASGTYFVTVANNEGCTSFSEIDVIDPCHTAATYLGGDIETDLNNSPSSCKENLTVSLPTGPNVVISGVNVYYSMTASGGGWMADQRSKIGVTNEGGGYEQSYFNGQGNTEGTYHYHRIDLSIANGVIGGGDINFEMDAWRTRGSAQTCGTLYNKVDEESWKIIVFYVDNDLRDTLEGFVYNSLGVPLENAFVSIDGVNGVYTNIEGYYLWENAPTFWQELTCTKQGYETQQDRIYVSLDSITSKDWYLAGNLPQLLAANVTNITNTTAMSGGEVTHEGNFPVSARGVVWNTEIMPTLELNNGFTDEGGGSGQFISELTELQPGTTYYLRAYATNADGTAYSNQFSFTTPFDKYLSIRVLLEGAYNGSNAMFTSLNNLGLIPHNQPYNQYPWNYEGNENFETIPPNMVDWVLFDLLRKQNLIFHEVEGFPKAMVLNSDGYIIGIDSALPTITLNPNDSIYVVVRHRNHLDVMSSSAMPIWNDTIFYDFSLGSDKAYGGLAGYKQIGENTYGMATGDGEPDAMISVLDFSYWAIQFGNDAGYYAADYDLDGQVAVLDFTKWAINFGIGNPLSNPIFQVIYRSQIPENK